MTPDGLTATHARAFAKTRGWSAPEFAALLANPGTILVGDATAFILGRVTVDEAEVLTLATDPAHQRRGLARVALDGFEATARTAGAKSVILEVAEDNHAAIALYAAASYVQVGRRPGYYATQTGNPVAALILQKLL